MPRWLQVTLAVLLVLVDAIAVALQMVQFVGGQSLGDLWNRLPGVILGRWTAIGPSEAAVIPLLIGAALLVVLSDNRIAREIAFTAAGASVVACALLVWYHIDWPRVFLTAPAMSAPSVTAGFAAILLLEPLTTLLVLVLTVAQLRRVLARGLRSGSARESGSVGSLDLPS